LLRLVHDFHDMLQPAQDEANGGGGPVFSKFGRQPAPSGPPPLPQQPQHPEAAVIELSVSSGWRKTVIGGGAMPYWWEKLPDERYWSEITDRRDIGADLKCLQRRENGRCAAQRGRLPGE